MVDNKLKVIDMLTKFENAKGKIESIDETKMFKGVSWDSRLVDMFEVGYFTSDFYFKFDYDNYLDVNIYFDANKEYSFDDFISIVDESFSRISPLGAGTEKETTLTVLNIVCQELYGKDYNGVFAKDLDKMFNGNSVKLSKEDGLYQNTRIPTAEEVYEQVMVIVEDERTVQELGDVHIIIAQTNGVSHKFDTAGPFVGIDGDEAFVDGTIQTTYLAVSLGTSYGGAGHVKIDIGGTRTKDIPRFDFTVEDKINLLNTKYDITEIAGDWAFTDYLSEDYDILDFTGPDDDPKIMEQIRGMLEVYESRVNLESDHYNGYTKVMGDLENELSLENPDDDFEK